MTGTGLVAHFILNNGATRALSLFSFSNTAQSDRRRWLARFREPKALRASSLISRLLPSLAALVIPVVTYALMPAHHWSTVSASVMSSGRWGRSAQKFWKRKRAGGDRGAFGGDVGVLEGQAEKVTREFLGLPGFVDVPAKGSHLCQLSS